MPEKGWYSLTVREETARKIGEMAEARGLTVDQLIDELLTPDLKGVWLTCVLCGARVKAGNLARRARDSASEISLPKRPLRRVATPSMSSLRSGRRSTVSGNPTKLFGYASSRSLCVHSIDRKKTY